MTIERSSKFRRDYKREVKTHGAGLDVIIFDVLSFLISGTPLPAKYQEHKLTGDWEGYRSCHIKPDLILNYEKLDDQTLRLVRLGSHSKGLLVVVKLPAAMLTRIALHTVLAAAPRFF